MGVWGEVFRTVVRTGVASAGAVAASAPEPAPPPGRRRRKGGKAGCTPCQAVDRIQKARKAYNLGD